jgi:hypothetical protein
MNDVKYIGLDVHQATISAAVLDFTGKRVIECVLETKATTILQFIHGLCGSLHVTLEEGTVHVYPSLIAEWSVLRNPRNLALTHVAILLLVLGQLSMIERASPATSS